MFHPESMLRVFLKNHDFDTDMLIRVMLIKKACNKAFKLL